MDRMDGFTKRIALAMAGRKSPWGSGGSDGAGGDEPHETPDTGSSSDGEPPAKGRVGGPRNPWLPPGGDKDTGKPGPRRSASIEDIFKNRGPEGPRRAGGGGGGNFRLPERRGGKSWFPLAIALIVGVLLFVTMVHQIAPREQGVVTTFGKYSSTLNSGLHITAPWPFQQVEVTDVTSIRSEKIPEGDEQKLILTGDQNLVDLSYVIRWNIKDLKQYMFQLAEPEETVREVAEAAMRASVAEQTLDATFSGAGRAEIEQGVRARMQALLDAYRAGIAVQGIEIERTDPPERVVEAFKDVSAAQQDADAELNRARAYAQQVLAQAEGDAASFDKIYEEYRMAPEVTRRRLYYETMESVLAKTDKTIVETNGVQTYLPLPEVQRRQRAPAASAPAPASGSQ